MSGVGGMRLGRRSLLQGGGALVVSFALAPLAGGQTISGADAGLGKSLDPQALDAYFTIAGDGSVTLYSGKVDLGTGLRIAYRQMLAEELGCAVDKIALIEGDTALTPNQGPTAGSTGIMVGGVQIRQAAATARRELIRLASERFKVPAEDLIAIDGEVRQKAGGGGLTFGDLIGGKRFDLKSDPKAPLKSPASYTIVGKPLKRPDVPGKLTGQHVYVHDFKLPGMLHGRVIRPPSVDAKLLEVDEASVARFGARVVRIASFLGVLAEDEWNAVRAARAIKARWTETADLVGHDKVVEWMKAGPFVGDESVVKRGDAGAVLANASRKISAAYYWPVQSHASMGPSCAVADVRSDGATIWTASQATHRFHGVFAKILDLPPEKVRLVYLDGAGCYGMNGHDDAAADAALMSKAVGKPVRVQWMREDELGWDPKGPPQYLEIEAAVSDYGKIAAWRTQMWLPKATANLPNVPLLGPVAAGISQTPGLSTGLISQNGNPSYPVANVEVTVHWLKDAPLRPSNIRAPGKIANNFAVESMVDELAALAGKDALAFRLQDMTDARGIEVLKRCAALLDWQARPAPAKSGVGRGIAYVHYKNSETYVAIAMEVAVDRSGGAIQVKRVACAHDCGLVINPDAARAQIEGNILQTLSRTLHEEVKFDKSRVLSVDWSSYPILTFPEVPPVLIELIDRPNERPLGVGEAAATPVPAALANAIFDATGMRLRTVPFTATRVKSALSG